MLKNKVVVITGASGGIGSAIALEFAKENATLVLVYRNKNKIFENLEKELTAEHISFLSVQTDLSKVADIKKLFSAVKEKYHSIDVLVNNAGIEPIFSDPLDTKQWNKVFDVNLFAPVECTREAVKIMKKASVVVNVSSLAGRTGIAYDFHATSYAASKAALGKFTEICAYQYAPNIRFFAVEPGFVKTSMWDPLTEDKEKMFAEKVPIKRFIRPDEIGDFIVSICKNDAINGQLLVIDGGLSLKHLF